METMENVKIILDNGVQANVNGIFYVFNSKYYFMYTIGEIDENEYIKLYIVQVCKEVQNTPTGPVDTGYMLGMEISNPEEWGKVQESITKIVEDKKNGTQSIEIHYLPINMLVNLKVVSKNKFKLMKHILEENFKVLIPSSVVQNENSTTDTDLNNRVENNGLVEIMQPNYGIDPLVKLSDKNSENNKISDDILKEDNIGDVIIDYRTRFFEEQEKNQVLEDQIRVLNEKLENIKNIIG